MRRRDFLVAAGAFAVAPLAQLQAAAERHLLYIAEPGIRNYPEYGGHGMLVFDIDHDYRFVKRIATAGLGADGKPENVKGVCASADTGLLHISTLSALTCVDLGSEMCKVSDT